MSALVNESMGVRRLVRCPERGLYDEYGEGDDAPDADMDATYITVAVIGDACVGKTSLLRRFLADEFDGARNETLGVDYSSLWLMTRHPAYDRLTNLKLIDTAGQERYAAIVPQMFNGAQGIALVFDSTDEQTYARVCNHWRPMVRRRNPYCTLALIANKCDLYDALPPDARWMDSIDWHDQARLLGCAGGFHRMSALDGRGVHSAFVELVDLSVEQEAEIARLHGPRESVDLVQVCYDDGVQPALKESQCAC
jgi:small GTP-binding protein